MQREGHESHGSLLGALALPLGLAALCAFLWYVTGTFRGGAARYEAIGPAFFPRLLIGTLAVLCIVQIAATLWRRGAASGANDGPVYWRDLGLGIGLTFAYAMALAPVGFILSTPLFQVALLALVFRVRSWMVLALVPLSLTLMLGLLFIAIMNAPLPRGRGVFGDFSRLFY